MLSFVYYEDVFLEKQKYNHEKDESFSIQILSSQILGKVALMQDDFAEL